MGDVLPGEERIDFGPWTLLARPEQTRAAFARMGRGGAEECTCLPCRNFAAARERIYPPAVRELFARLGVDYRKEAEAVHHGRLDDGRHLYGGWLHCVGTLVSGPDVRVPTGPGTSTFSFEPFGEAFGMGISRNAVLVEPELRGLPLLQLEIEAKVPWLLPEPGPE